MGIPGPKPRWRKFVWSPNLAYAVGLFATDGCLYNNGRHMDFTSKDREQLQNFKKCLGLKVKITYKTSGFTSKKYPRLQWGDVVLYKFFTDIGLTPHKSKTLGSLKIPGKYFFDFLRGHHDGDGSFYSYYDPRWRSSFMYYLIFASASREHITWIQETIFRMVNVHGHVTKSGALHQLYQLKYAKKEGLIVLHSMYYKKNLMSLSRKRLKIERALRIVGEPLIGRNARVL